MRIAVVAGLLLALCAASAWASDRLEVLGGYERQALDRALALRGLEVEPAPDGKILRVIHVDNQSVFTDGEGMLTWLNALHRTTREDVIEREVLLRPGQRWDEAVIEDSKRRLRDPRFTSLVVMVPVRAPEPDRVDLLVVTRDIWSLRLNSSYEIQNGDLVRLLIAPAESNLLGLRKHLALLFDLDQGAYSMGPHYLDTNIGGSRLRLDARSAVVFSREQGELEGTRNEIALTYPLWSLQRHWGANLTVVHFDDIRRDYQGLELRPRDLEGTPDVQETVPYIYDRRSTQIDTSAIRSLGDDVKQYLRFGYELVITRPELHDLGPTAEQCAGTPLPDCVRLFREEVLPRSERTSALYTEYSVFTPSFETYRNVDTYDLPEERQLGPDLRVGMAVARKFLGSEQDFLRLSAQTGWTSPLGPNGFANTTLSATSRLQDGDLVNSDIQASVVAVSPTLLDRLRVVGRAELAMFIKDGENRFLTLGGDTGLRGYDVGAFAGERRVRGNVEVRSIPRRLWFSRVGVLAFWDAGHAADRLSDLSIHHDVGLGIRAVIPQVQTAVFRLDWAVPLTGDTAGLPGRFILGFEQAFNVLGTSPVLDATTL
ncbi:MAG TPA: hypothetical protein VNM90_22135 [Haliangium sp.]|nr:hypothetical protein [Haliangium sp.]